IPERDILISQANELRFQFTTDPIQPETHSIKPAERNAAKRINHRRSFDGPTFCNKVVVNLSNESATEFRWVSKGIIRNQPLPRLTVEASPDIFNHVNFSHYWFHPRIPFLISWSACHARAKLKL